MPVEREGVQPVREFYGVMAARGAAGDYFVTSGEYTADAKAFVQGRNLELIDGRRLRVSEAQERRPGREKCGWSGRFRGTFKPKPDN